MKGLLVKDFKLLKMQKNFFIIIVAIAIGMTVLYEDIAFMIGFLTFVISLFTLSTISYDEFDNGYAFLFTLPVSRTGYTVEKYCFSLLLGGSAWIVSALLAVIASLLKEATPLSDTMMIALMIVPVMLVIQAVMIPFQLKFGGEKGRIVITAAIGLLFIIGIAVVKGAEILGIDMLNVINNLPTVNMGMLIAAATAAASAVWLVSMKISISIMNRKEF